jgi:hypothetical protein
MKMKVEVLADLIIHAFVKGLNYEVGGVNIPKEDLSDLEKALDEYHLFKPAEGEDGDWDYNDQT